MFQILYVRIYYLLLISKDFHNSTRYYFAPFTLTILFLFGRLKSMRCKNFYYIFNVKSESKEDLGKANDKSHIFGTVPFHIDYQISTSMWISDKRMKQVREHYYDGGFFLDELSIF